MINELSGMATYVGYDGCFAIFQMVKEVPLPSASSEALLWTGRGACISSHYTLAKL